MNDDRISTDVERGVHIPLTCVNHPNLRWMTKNIGWIGARSIFFRGGANGEHAGWMPQMDMLHLQKDAAPEYGIFQRLLDTVNDQRLQGAVFECSCPCSDLQIVGEVNV